MYTALSGISTLTPFPACAIPNSFFLYQHGYTSICYSVSSGMEALTGQKLPLYTLFCLASHLYAFPEEMEGIFTDFCKSVMI